MAEGEAPQLTNGLLVRFVGRNKIRDGFLTSFVWCFLALVTVGLIPLYWIIRAKQVRKGQGWAATFYQIFGWGTRAACVEDCQLPSPAPKSSPDNISFAFITDTHCLHARLDIPDTDVIIHAGDFSNHGSKAEVETFARWFTSLPHRHKILIPGNHDMIMDQEYFASYWSDWGVKKETLADDIWTGVHVLVDSMVEIEGVRVYGSPWVPKYAEWRTAFNKPLDELEEVWARIPAKNHADGGIDILVTHSPPHGILDMEPLGAHAGCRILATHVAERIQPKYHLFGHVHSDHGMIKVGGVTYCNAAAVTDFYSVRKDCAIQFSFPRKEP